MQIKGNALSDAHIPAAFLDLEANLEGRSRCRSVQRTSSLVRSSYVTPRLGVDLQATKGRSRGNAPGNACA
jgi:hypothetical protein